METVKILFIDFSSTALYNIFMLNKNWVHSFDLSQLPSKTAVLSDTSLSFFPSYTCAAQTHLFAQIFSVSVGFQ